jgi:hypothetical protein
MPSRLSLALFDWGLTALHVLFIAAFVLLWIPRSTVRLHRWVVGLTVLSWIGAGFFKGFGYCVLTDLHWQVKRARGVTHLPGSFIKYAADAVTGRNIPATWVDTTALVVFLVGILAAVLRYRTERAATGSTTPSRR